MPLFSLPRLFRRRQRAAASVARPAQARLRVEALEDRSVPASLPPAEPDLVMRAATAPDARKVRFDYDVTGALAKPVAVQVYRSADAEFSADDVPVLKKPVTLKGSWLKEGAHEYTVKLPRGLRSDPERKYVLVAANVDKTVPEGDYGNDVAEFRKYLLGAVTHGFTLTGLLPEPVGGVPDWVGNMAAQLEDYDAAIAFDWAADSSKPAAGLAVAAGERLAAEVKAQIATLGLADGDVVDLHFIGHSRGVVVITQAMAEVARWSDPAVKGGYTRLTLLDPHPTSRSPRAARALYSLPGDVNVRERAILGLALAFEAASRDPAVTIPKNVQEVDLLYQHTPASQLTWPRLEPRINLWGTTKYRNLSKAKVRVVNLTGEADHGGVIGVFAATVPNLWL